MAIGGGKRKWRNAVGFASSLAAAAGVELSVYCRDRRCHGIEAEELVQMCMGARGGGRRGEGFCDVGMVRVFFNWVVRVFYPTKNFGGDGLLEPTVCD